MGKQKGVKIDEKLKELENVIKRFEAGKLDIEDGIGEYEKGAKLIREIKKELTGLEVKVEKIRGSY
ncbi:exodeoxyribonuclease VII small subunit [Candidatus Dojkabacteria bacterium]|nr:exodeoxyribonuclease VII small subunit [Candidatus Dojkabacteria bacterium]